MNKCCFIGRLTDEPVITRDNNTIKVNFEIALTRRFKKSNGELGRQIDYIKCEAWDSGAEVIARSFKKGDLIVIHASARSISNSVVFRVTEFEFPSACGLFND